MSDSTDSAKQPLDMVRLRGEVVGHFAGFEVLIDTVITLYYVDNEHRADFYTDVLADENVSFGLRRNVLRKVLRRRGELNGSVEKICQRIAELGNIRNKF